MTRDMLRFAEQLGREVILKTRSFNYAVVNTLFCHPEPVTGRC